MTDRGKALLGGRRRSRACQLLDVAGDVHWPHVRDRGHTVMLAPPQKLAHRLRVGAAGVAIADVGGEEFDEALLRARAGGCDERGGAVSGYRDELVPQLRPRPHSPTRRHAALRSMPPHRLGWSVRTSLGFWVSFTPCPASTTNSFAPFTTGCAAAISSSSVPIASPNRTIERSLPSEKYWRAS